MSEIEVPESKASIDDTKDDDINNDDINDDNINGDDINDDDINDDDTKDDIKDESKSNTSKNVVEKWIPMPTGQNEEALLRTQNGRTVDDRKPAPPNVDNKDLYSIGRLRMSFKLNNVITNYTGTGVLLNVTEYSNEYKCNIWYGLTAAHNLTDKGADKFYGPESVSFEIRKNIGTTQDQRSQLVYNPFEVINYIIHPEYFKNNTPSSGYDIALFIIKDVKNVLNEVKIKCLPLKTKSYKHSYIAKLIGYPTTYYNSNDQEMKHTNWLYGMVGRYTIYDNKLLLYKDIDTTGGQSGSPVFGITNGGNNINNIYNNWDNVCIIGIHTGAATIEGSEVNIGTYISDDILKWIKHNIPQQ